MKLKECLKMMIEKKASDLFYRPGGKVQMRINGSLVPISETLLSLDEMNQTLKEFLTEEQQEKYKLYPDIDFAFYAPELGNRFRVSIFRQRNFPSMVIRNVPAEIGSMESLHLPVEVLQALARESRGMILLTGTTGSGKSTTIASMIEYINTHAHKHILTLEEPIEYTFKDRLSIVNQRELGIDVASYPVALRAFTLQSPDVIYIGNIRDAETMAAALTAAETGVLVLSTLHTVNASQTLERIVSFYPPHQHPQLRIQLALYLKGVISLRLVPLKDGSGRIPAYEIMVQTPTISRLIREGKSHEIPQFIEDGAVNGMISFRQSLGKLVTEGLVTEETAMQFADNKDEFQLVLKGIKRM